MNISHPLIKANGPLFSFFKNLPTQNFTQFTGNAFQASLLISEWLNLFVVSINFIFPGPVSNLLNFISFEWVISTHSLIILNHAYRTLKPCITAPFRSVFTFEINFVTVFSGQGAGSPCVYVFSSFLSLILYELWSVKLTWICKSGEESNKKNQEVIY